MQGCSAKEGVVSIRPVFDSIFAAPFALSELAQQGLHAAAAGVHQGLDAAAAGAQQGLDAAVAGAQQGLDAAAAALPPPNSSSISAE